MLSNWFNENPCFENQSINHSETGRRSDKFLHQPLVSTHICMSEHTTCVYNTLYMHIQILKIFFKCRLNMCISNQAFLLRHQWFWDLPILVGSWGVWEERELCSGASEAVSWSATEKGEKQNSATTEISFSHISLKIIVHRAWLLPTSGGCAETQSPNSVIWICSPLLAHLLGDLAESTAYWDPCVQGHLAVAGKGHLLCPSAHTCLSVALFVHLHIDIFLFPWGIYFHLNDSFLQLQSELNLSAIISIFLSDMSKTFNLSSTEDFSFCVKHRCWLLPCVCVQ